MEVILNPDDEVQSMPLNSYYAFATPQQGFTAGLAASKACLSDVPGNKVLTMNVEVPEAWLIEVWSTENLTPAHNSLTVDSVCCPCNLCS